MKCNVMLVTSGIGLVVILAMMYWQVNDISEIQFVGTVSWYWPLK